MVNENSNKIRFAVVGCGYIGLRHIELIANNPEAELVALIDVKNKNELNIGKYEVEFHDSLDSYLSIKPVVDVVTIATPNGVHAVQGAAVLKAGIHAVIEKPLALNKADAEYIHKLSEEKNRQVFSVMQNRYSPPSLCLKDLIQKGVLGQIYMVQLNCYWNRDDRYYFPAGWHGTKKLDGGTLFTQFSHFIDIMYWLFGDIKNINSHFANNNHKHSTEFEDGGVVFFEFLNGGMGSLNFSTAVWDKNMESSITVIGENGSIKIGGQYMDKVEYCHIKNYELPQLLPTSPANNYGAYSGSAFNHAQVIENVIDVLKGRSINNCNASDGLMVVDIIERMYASGSETIQHFVAPLSKGAI